MKKTFRNHPLHKPTIPVMALLLLITSTLFAKDFSREVLEASPFSLSKEELLKANSPDRPEGLDVDVILDKTEFKINPDGTVVKTYYSIYKILTQEGVDNWAYSSSYYYPWYQNKPQITARVITEEGVEQYLDTNTIVIQSASSSSNSYTDRHKLSAPLPNIRIGAVVEEVIQTSDHKPYFNAGRNFSIPFYAYNFTGITNVTIEYPKEMEFNYRVNRKKIKPDVSSNGDNKILSYMMKNLKPFYDFPSTTLPDLSIVPFLTFSTAKSWNDVATQYSNEVNAKIDISALKPIADSILTNESDSLVMIQKLVKFIHDEVRYTAYELGDNSLIPESPMKILNKKYGDCKDKATLLVGLLRASGFTSHVALLSTGPGFDVDPSMPGTDQFDHAIVHLKLNNNSIWIDATSQYSKVGVIPSMDENRSVLIASKETKELSRTPIPQAEKNKYIEDIHVLFMDDSNATIYENLVADGTIEVGLRASYDSPKEQFLKDATDYYSERYGGVPTDLTAEDMKNVNKPFSLNITVDNAELFPSNDAGTSVSLSPYGLFEYLPNALFQDSLPLDSLKKVEKRYDYADKFPLYISFPHVNSSTYRLKSPNGFVWKAVPDSLEISGYGLTLSRKSEFAAQDSIVVTYTLQMDSVAIDTSHIDSVKSMIEKFYDVSSATLEYVYAADDLIAQGELQKGIQMHRDIIEKEKSSNAYLRFAEALNMLQFRDEAIRNTKKAIELEPKCARAYYALGLYYMHNELGQYRSAGADLANARASLEKAIEIDSTQEYFYTLLYQIYVMNDQLKNWAEGADIEKGIALINEMKKRFETNAYDLDLLRGYLWSGDYENADKVAMAAPYSEQRDILWIASRFLNKGAAEAEKKAKELSPSNYVTYLAQSVSVLVVIEKYKEAYEFLTSSQAIQNSGTLNSNQLTMFKMVAEKDEILKKQTDFEREISQLIYDLMTKKVSKEQFIAQLTKSSKGKYFEKEGIELFIDGLEIFKSGSFPINFVADLLISQFRYSKEESENSITMKVYRGNSPTEIATFYYAKERSKHRLLNVVSGTKPLNFYSTMALSALEEKELKEADHWLEKGREAVNDWGNLRDQYQNANAVKALLPKTRDSLSIEELKLGAAVLSFGYSKNEKAVEVVNAFPENSLKTDDAKFALKWYRAMLTYKDTPAKATESLKELLELHPEDQALFSKYLRSLLQAEEYEKLYEELEIFDNRFDAKEYVQAIKSNAEIEKGNYSSVLKDALERSQKNNVYASELNEIAWMALFKSNEYQDAITLSEASIKIEADNMASLHTLAMLYAKNNQLSLAHEAFKKLLLQTTVETADNSIWCLRGTIAESLGLRTYADETYEKMEKPESDYKYSSWHLINSPKEKVTTAQK